MENQKSKKGLIAVCIIVLIIIAAIVAVVVLKGKDDTSDSKSDKNEKEAVETVDSGYEGQINAFIEGMNDSTKMEEFVSKNVDFRAIYAMENMSQDVDENDAAAVQEAFKKAYDEATPEKYEADDFKTEVNQLFQTLSYYKAMMGENASVSAENIGEASDYTEMALFKQVPFKLVLKSEENSQDMDFIAIFYNDKFVIATPSEDEN